MGKVATSKRGLSTTEELFWKFLCFGTLGLLYPLYRMRKHSAERKETFYAA